MSSITENKNIIQDMIKKYHNPNLVQPDASPNGNKIYHIYSDGEITNQKGGFAYLRRSEFIVKSAVLSSFEKRSFPIKSLTFSYAIVTEEHAVLIRNALMAEAGQSLP
jgi:hypothetical protein